MNLKKKIYYWSPFLVRIATPRAVVNSAYAMQKFNNLNDVVNLFKANKYNLIYKSKRKPGKHNILKKNEYFYRDLIFEGNH